jgi:hypothetical protein
VRGTAKLSLPSGYKAGSKALDEHASAARLISINTCGDGSHSTCFYLGEAPESELLADYEPLKATDGTLEFGFDNTGGSAIFDGLEYYGTGEAPTSQNSFELAAGRYAVKLWRRRFDLDDEENGEKMDATGSFSQSDQRILNNTGIMLLAGMFLATFVLAFALSTKIYWLAAAIGVLELVLWLKFRARNTPARRALVIELARRQSELDAKWPAIIVMITPTQAALPGARLALE